MKKNFVLLFSFLLITNISFGQSGWFWQNPTPTLNNINSVIFKGTDTIITVGDGGMILRSNNIGNSWYPQTSGFQILNSINDIKFVNATKGILLGGSTNYGGSGAVMTTTNGGINWFNTYSGSYSFYNIFILDSVSQYVVSNANILKSNNGGLTWTNLLNYSNLRGVSFINNVTGFAVGFSTIISGGFPPTSYDRSLILKTTNGGSSWSVDSIGNGFRLNNIVFSNSNTGFILCSDNHLFKTTNAGLNWFNQTDASTGMTRMICLDSNTFFLIGTGGLMKTTNGGLSWGTRLPQNLKGIAFNNSGTGIFGGKNGTLYKTTNYGVTWLNLQSGFYATDDWEQFNAVFFADNNNGTTVGNKNGIGGVIYHTSNGGQNWIPTSGISGGSLNDVFFLNIETGYVVGYPGLVFKTTNAGSVWTLKQINNNTDLYGVYFVNLNTGFIVGGGGEIGKTTNAGQTWNVQYINNYPTLNKIYFYNDSVGAIVGAGQGGTILWTTDCGSTWMTRNSGLNTYTSFNGISIINATTGIIADRDSRILKTTNSGLNWNIVFAGSTYYSFNRVCFKDSQNGIVVGNNGVILRTTNYGENWIAEQSNTRTNLYGCSLKGPKDIAVSGNYLSILTKTDLSIIGINPISNQTPNNFALHQNYPNPFNPITKIKFDISKSSFAKIIIYDILGREFATLINEELKPGTYSVDWDGSNYSSGIYFYRLEANPSDRLERSDGYVETKKMVLMK